MCTAGKRCYILCTLCMHTVYLCIQQGRGLVNISHCADSPFVAETGLVSCRRMTLLKPRCSVLCLFLFLVSRVGSLAIEYLTIGNGPASYLEFPLVWLVPSLGLIFTMFDMFRGLRAYYVMSERLQCRLRWRDWSVFKRFLLTIITLSAILAARDMCLRWVKFHRKWTGDYPWYSCFAFLYIAFILLQGKSEQDGGRVLY